MEQPVAMQSAQFALAAACGAALALWYDVLRALRRRARWLRVPLDALFFLSALAFLLLEALYVGRGQFRIFMGAGTALGAAFWFLTASGPFLRASVAFFGLILRMFDPVRAGMRRLAGKTKKLFDFYK